MHNEEHQKSARREGAIKNEVLKDVVVGGSFGVIGCGNYRLQVQKHDYTKEVERTINDLSHICHDITE
jgi:hypothetical protein